MNDMLMSTPDRKRHIGRVVRAIVDSHLRHGDGSGEADARRALDALAHDFDPGHARALAAAEKYAEIEQEGDTTT